MKKKMDKLVAVRELLVHDGPFQVLGPLAQRDKACAETLEE